MAPKIFYDPTSPCCQAPLAFAKLLGIELDEQLIDLAKGEQRQPEYLSIYSLGHVPFLEVRAADEIGLSGRVASRALVPPPLPAI